MLASADDPRPTMCGILILGKHPRDYLPGAYVQFLRIAGTALDCPIVDERLFDGPIGSLIGGLEDKLDSHNRTAVDVTSGTLETRSSTHALGALRQLVRNAVMHRSYEGAGAQCRTEMTPVCAAGRERGGGVAVDRLAGRRVWCA